MTTFLQELLRYGPLLSALGTFALAYLALRQVRALNRQITQGQQQVDQGQAQVENAEKSAQNAAAALEESVRVRIDQDAPRVLAFMEGTAWPPRINRDLMSGGGGSSLLSEASVERSEAAEDREFVFNADQNKFLWFRGRGLLFNEGRSTARVRLTGARFISGTSSLAPGQTIDVPAMLSDSTWMALLPPGSHALFEWAGGHTLEEWADAYTNPHPPNPHGSCMFWITVFDPREIGIVDTINIEMTGKPIEPVPSKTGHWRLVDDPKSVGVGTYPIRRNYTHESPTHEDISQIQERYKEWMDNDRASQSSS